MNTTKNTFRKHDPKRARRNPDALNVRRYRTDISRDGVYTLTDIVDGDTAVNLLEKYISEERLIGMCIGVGIGIVPLVIVNFLLW